MRRTKDTVLNAKLQTFDDGWGLLRRLAIQAIYARDYPVVQAVVFFFAVIFVISNLLADVLSAVLDPRVRFR